MDISSIAAAVIGVETSRMQFAVAARLMRIGGDQQASALKLIDAGQQTVDRLANVVAGAGLDITA